MDGLDFAPERPAERLRRLIADSATVAVFTGAGVSTESGIPEVRPPGGTASRAMTARGNGSGPDGRSPGTKKAPPGVAPAARSFISSCPPPRPTRSGD